ncbi:MAG: insulinase family protein [Sphingobacteriales bacterium]|nr:insulinase family protein [Sphingobacteriales bacterium]
MIHFERFNLPNGLRVLVHEDHTVPMAVLNVLYDVGAKDENPNQTGFAHLFEHLMFGGSINIPSYDEPLQKVGGENNAFTNNDITNYYIQLPSINMETAFWLESDRMLSLAFSDKSLETQRSVVIEEFKQRYLNQPYGDVWLKLRPLAYQKHPYQWPTIGKEVAHIEDAKMEDVKAFFHKHYTPQNAILVVAGAVKLEEVKSLTCKWFGDIPAGNKYERNLPQEPVQLEARVQSTSADVPNDAIYKAFHIHERNSKEYYIADVISDILSRGESSRMYQELVKNKKIFSEVNAYITGDIEAGLFVLEGKPAKGITLEQADEALWEVVNHLKHSKIETRELQKIVNKLESSTVFGEMNLLNKAMNMAYYELLGDADLMNTEMDRYRSVTSEDIELYATQVFVPTNCSTLFYHSNHQE